MTEYRFVTYWHLEAPLREIYDAIVESLHWPAWWEGAERVEDRVPGDADGIGSVRRYTWKSRHGYRLTFDARTIRIEPCALLEAVVSGDLEGRGTWRLWHAEGVTTVRYEWHVHTGRPWMTLLAPLARRVFEANHHALMQNGAEGLARLLNVRLMKVSNAALPPTSDCEQELPAPHRIAPHTPKHHAINRAAALVAGIGAGTIATTIQLALWWIFALPLPDILLRDARLAAAIVMGPDVLPPPASFQWDVILVATAVHFVLSIGYALMLAPVVSRLARLPAVLAGALFGLGLYGINMYGFTLLFPWFEASRDWITASAHLSFGVAAASIYKQCEENGWCMRR